MGWQTVAIPGGATLAYPPGWRRIRTDPDTASVALMGPDDRFLGYLNLTPRQGEETLADWSRFRVNHNREEGDRSVTAQASATGLRFRTGRGSCVRDVYVTQTASRYIELACIVAGRRATTVVVGASPPSSWRRVSALLEQAISSITT